MPEPFVKHSTIVVGERSDQVRQNKGIVFGSHCRKAAMLQARLLVTSLSVVLLSACVIAPYQYGRQSPYSQPAYYPSTGDQSEVVTDVAPPAPYGEAVPVLPFLGALWLSGYWSWNGGRHEWVPGRWEQPRAGYGWRPHAWVQQGGRWHLHAGGRYRRQWLS